MTEVPTLANHAPVTGRPPHPGIEGRPATRVAPADAGSIAAAWGSLAERAVEPNAFFDPDFFLAAASHLDGNPSLAVVRSDSGAVVALAPVARARLGRIAPAVRIWTHDYAPLGTPLVDRDDIAGAVAAFVEDVAPDASLVVPDVPLDCAVAAALRSAAEASARPMAVVDPHQRAMLRRPQAADIRATLPTRRRKEFARQMRRLGDLGRLAVESATEPDLVRARFEEYLALEAAGWKGRRGSALASSPATAAFAREAVFNASESGAARIDSIRLDAHPVAILTTFVSGDTAWTWKIAYDEAFARFSPGAQLMLEAARAIFADPRIALINSCAAADHPMIDHLWRERLLVGTLVLGPPGGGAVHRIGLAAFKAEIEARHAARRLKARIKGTNRNRETEE